MNEEIVRVATPEDASAIATLSGELGYPATVAAIERRLVALAHVAGSDAVFVADLDGVVRGWIHVAGVRTVENDPYAEIRGLVVTESSRGTGIGSRLVRSAERWAIERGLERVRVRTNVSRTRTHNFYEKLGYRLSKTQTVFDHSLG